MNYDNIGVFIDMVGNGAFNIKTMKKFIDVISKMGYNLLEIGIDDMFKIDSEPFFGYLRGGYNKEFIQEIDKYAQEKGIKLVPCIQTLGHMDNVLSNPHYFDLIDIENIMLVDNEKVDRLIEKMFKTLREYFSSDMINLGFDEAHYVGLGNYLDKYGYHNRYELLLRHLNKVVKMANKYDFKVHIWADMFYKLSNNGRYIDKGIKIPDHVIDQIPKGIGLCYWDYDTTDEEIYDSMFKTLEDTKCDIWFSGGAYTWWGYAPNNQYSINVSKHALKIANKHNIKNIMFTLWGNAGHECSFFSVIPSLYVMKKYSENIYDINVIKQGFKETIGYDFDDFMLLDLPNKNDYNPNCLKPDSTSRALLLNDCFLGKRDLQLSYINKIPFDEYKKQLEEVAPKMGEYSYLFTNLSKLCDCLSYKAYLGIKTRSAYKNKDNLQLKKLLSDYYETINKLEEFKSTYRVVWMLENTPYGWDYHEKKLGGLIYRIKDCALRIEEYLENNEKTIPELEDEILEYGEWSSMIW